ncbi:MAG: molybdenum cofactor biosynthesis protein MoaE [Nitrospinae bacterium]|nr:molybdenum cofactor biosynthesis protein MoaE [Nitrospinota bacterium]
MRARIQTKDFSVDEEIRLCAGGRTDIGGVAVFTGVVRDVSRDKRITRMELTHYEGMAEKKLAQVCDEAATRFGADNVTITHRVGALAPGDNIVCVVAVARHRKAALEACAFAIEELKKSVPIWKKEFTEDGESWVE